MLKIRWPSFLPNYSNSRALNQLYAYIVDGTAQGERICVVDPLDISNENFQLCLKSESLPDPERWDYR